MSKPHTAAPEHVGLILDGNRRWATGKGLPTLEGHRQGAEAFKTVALAAFDRGVRYVSAYAFSTENWNRPKYEVDALMELLVSTIRREVDDLKKNNVKLLVIGDFASLPEICQQELNEGPRRKLRIVA